MLTLLAAVTPPNPNDPNLKLLDAIGAGAAGLSVIVLMCILGFLLFLCIMSAVLPFAIFGVKRRLDETNAHLRVIVQLMAAVPPRPAPGPAPRPEPELPDLPEPPGHWTGFSSPR